MGDSFSSKKPTVRWLLIVGFLALCLRVWTLAVTSHAPYYTLMSLEAAETARNLLDNHGYATDGSTGPLARLQVERKQLIDIDAYDVAGHKAIDPTTRRYNLYSDILPTYTRPWGYPLFLAMTFSLTDGERYLPAQIVQMFLDSIAALLVLLLGLRLFPPFVARFGALLYALFPPFAFLATRPLWDAFALPLLVVALYFTLRIAQARDWKATLTHAGLAGLAVGVGYNFRFEFIVLPLFLGAALLALMPIKRWLPAMATLSLACVLLVAPWALRNHSQTGHLLLTGTSAYVLYEALGEQPDNPWGIECSDKAMNILAVSQGFANAFMPPAHFWFKQQYKDAIQAHPDAFAKAALMRLPHALLSTGLETLGPQHMRPTLDGYASYAAVRLGAPVVAGLAIVGLILMLAAGRRRIGVLAFSLTPALFVISTHVLTHWETRYTVPAYLSFGWLAALALCWAWRRIRPDRSSAAASTCRWPDTNEG